MARRRPLPLAKFAHEIASKSDARIERDVAEGWASRAVACYRLYARSNKIIYLTRADNYRHEALEHASAVNDFGRTVCELQTQIDKEIKKLRIEEMVESKKRPTARRRRRS